AAPALEESLRIFELYASSHHGCLFVHQAPHFFKDRSISAVHGSSYGNAIFCARTRANSSRITLAARLEAKLRIHILVRWHRYLESSTFRSSIVTLPSTRVTGSRGF